MLRYLLLLANPAQLFPVNPGKAEQTSRSVIVLGTDHEHDDGRGRIRSFSRRTMKVVSARVKRRPASLRVAKASALILRRNHAAEQSIASYSYVPDGCAHVEADQRV
jgi:hypothetical protein